MTWVAYVGIVPASWLLAQAPASGSSDTTWVGYLLNGGPFAVFLLLIVLDKIGTHGERDRLRIENAELRKEISDINGNLRTDIVPQLTKNTDTMKSVLEILETSPIRRRAREGG